jgi:hypothetical protein
MKGALAAGLPTFLALNLVPSLYLASLPTLQWFLHQVPLLQPLAPFLALTALFVAPALLALPAAMISARVARGSARQGEDLGLATAAGAGIATTGLTLGAVFLRLEAVRELIILAPLFLAAALFVGVVGSFTFLAIRRPKGLRRGVPRPLPSLYPSLIAAGLGGPLLLLGGGLWAGLASLFPFLSPRFLAGLFQGALSLSGVEALTATIALGALAPLTYGLGKRLRKAFPGANPRGLSLGLFLPSLIPFLGVLGLSQTSLYLPTSTIMLLGCLAGALPHLFAAIFASLHPGSSDSPLFPLERGKRQQLPS